MGPILICKQEKQPSGYIASIPLKFPVEGLFDIPVTLLTKVVAAERLIGKLDGITKTIPDIGFFLKMFAYKDATYSSQIEGTQATLSDALEASQHINTKNTDADDILFYMKALDHGIERIKELPISLRFIREIHKKLMAGARQTHFSDPGNFRTSQNWIGGTTPNNAGFVPVPANQMKDSLHDLELFLHNNMLPFPIVSIAYAHAQFETIHPFLDGNGRVGRLLITFLLMQQKILEAPVLFLSAFFKKHQKLYYKKIDGYHNGEVLQWLEFFLDGVMETAEKSITVSHEINQTKDRDMQKIQALSKRESESGVRVLNYLFENPIITSGSVIQATGFTRAGAQKLIDRFIKLGILVERAKETNYDRTYVYRDYFNSFLTE